MLSVMLSSQPWLSKVGNAIQTFALTLDGPGMFLVALADSSFLSIPEGNDFLIVILSTGETWQRVGYYIAMTTLGSVCGCLFLYALGRKGGSPLFRRRFSEESIERAEGLFKRFGIFSVIVPSILPPPCPFKVFVFGAGVFRLPWGTFITAVVIGRTIRYSIWGVLAYLYGSSIKIYMQQNMTSVGFGLFGLFLAIIVLSIWVAVKKGRRDNAGGVLENGSEHLGEK